MQVFQAFTSRFETPLTNFMDAGVNNLTGAVNGPLRVALLLYVILYGYAVMRGAIVEPASEFAWRGIKIAIIIMLATGAGDYNTYVKQLFFDTLPKEIGNVFVTGSASGLNTGASFDTFLDKVFKYGYDLWQGAQWSDFFTIALAVAVIIAGALATMFLFAIVLYAKIGLSLVIALGPVFVALILFASTRPFGEAWIRQLANFVILQILAMAVVGLFLTTLDSVLQTSAPEPSDKAYAAIAIIALLSLGGYIALQLPEIASGLAGGGANLSSSVASRFFGGGQAAEAYRGVRDWRRTSRWAKATGQRLGSTSR